MESLHRAACPSHTYIEDHMSTQNKTHNNATMTEDDMLTLIGDTRMAALIKHVIGHHLSDHGYASATEAYWAIVDMEEDEDFYELDIVVWEPYEYMDYDNFRDTLTSNLSALMRLVIENFM
jgi:hypothetical protein